MRKLLAIVIVLLVSFGLFYLFCVHYTDSYQVAVVWNPMTGELSCDTNGGFHLTAPWVQAARIDTRPQRVCITSAGRGFNCRLVQFQPSAYREFVEVQGFHYWWWANRFSYNGGYDEEYRGMKDLMRGYTYGVKQYPFVRVLRDYPLPGS